MCWRYVWAVVLHSYVICRPCCHWFGSQTAGTDLSVVKFGWPLMYGATTYLNVSLGVQYSFRAVVAQHHLHML